MNKETKKSPADISIERVNEILIKYGLPPSKTVSGTGTFIYIPAKDSPLLKYLKEKERTKRSTIE